VIGVHDWWDAWPFVAPHCDPGEDTRRDPSASSATGGHQ